MTRKSCRVGQKRRSCSASNYYGCHMKQKNAGEIKQPNFYLRDASLQGKGEPVGGGGGTVPLSTAQEESNQSRSSSRPGTLSNLASEAVGGEDNRTSTVSNEFWIGREERDSTFYLNAEVFRARRRRERYRATPRNIRSHGTVRVVPYQTGAFLVGASMLLRRHWLDI